MSKQKYVLLKVQLALLLSPLHPPAFSSSPLLTSPPSNKVRVQRKEGTQNARFVLIYVRDGVKIKKTPVDLQLPTSILDYNRQQKRAPLPQIRFPWYVQSVAVRLSLPVVEEVTQVQHFFLSQKRIEREGKRHAEWKSCVHQPVITS